MASALRGQATRRFYKAFYAWSKAGGVSHQQRCAITISKHFVNPNKEHPRQVERRERGEPDPSQSQLDKPPFNRQFARMVPTKYLSILEANKAELLRQIEWTFNVKITIEPSSSTHGVRTRINGDRSDVEAALAFIFDIELKDTRRPQHPGPKVLPSDIPKPDLYKAIMRNVPSSVVILATHLTTEYRPDANYTHNSVRGMSVSSMTSVTLDPEPIVSFSIRRPSRTLDCILQGRPFSVNFPMPNESGAKIAHIFSKPHHDPLEPFNTVVESGLCRIVRSKDPHHATIIRGGHMAAFFICEILPGKTVEIGDHTVIFARVMDSYMFKRQISRFPIFLAYSQGQYRCVDRDSSLQVEDPDVAKLADSASVAESDSPAESPASVSNTTSRSQPQPEKTLPQSQQDSGWLDSHSHQTRQPEQDQTKPQEQPELQDKQQSQDQPEVDQPEQEDQQDTAPITQGATSSELEESARAEEFSKKYWDINDEDDVNADADAQDNKKPGQ